MSEEKTNAQEPAEETPNTPVEDTSVDSVQEEVVEEVAAPVEEAPVVEETVVAEEAPVAEEVVAEVEEAPKAEEVEEAPKAEKAPRKRKSLEDLLSHDEPVEFDWDAEDGDVDEYTSEDRSKFSDIYENTLNQIQERQVVSGTIVGANSREVIVNIGFKSDGIISRNELRYMDEIVTGEEIDVYVENQEDTNGQLILSHKKARTLKSWERVNNAETNDEIINGKVKCRTKGGLIVDVFGIEAFLPGSQIDIKPIRDYDQYVGKTMEFKVVKINNEFKNVVVSHKALIQDELEKQKTEIMSKLEKGQVLEGSVKNITSYGVFIDLGGVDGLIHITDLSWGRINHPEEIVTLDEKINVVILDYDEDKKRIALGLKQLTPHPWDSLEEGIKVGDKVKGKVVVIADYGAFIEIQSGVEGLIHVSEMSWSQHLRTAQDFLKVGQEVEAVVLTLDRDERKMSLGMKQLIPDPWDKIAERYPKESKHEASVRNFTNFGIFVELEEGVDGLIHISDLSWSKKIKHPAEFTQIGEKIEVLVLDVDIENRRLSLGHKQLKENPWDVFETVFEVGSIHEGTVTQVNDKGAVVTLPYGVEGFAPNRHLAKKEGGKVTKDETIDFKVIEFSKDSKKIILSHTRIHQDEERGQKHADDASKQKQHKQTQAQMKKMNDKSEKTTLGDLGVLATLKAEMKEEEKAKAQEFLKQAEKAEEAKVEETKTEEVAEEPKAEAVVEEVKEEPKVEAVVEEVKEEKVEEVKEVEAEEAKTEETPATEEPEAETETEAKEEK